MIFKTINIFGVLFNKNKKAFQGSDFISVQPRGIRPVRIPVRPVGDPELMLQLLFSALVLMFRVSIDQI
jgi:hypothetical protein